MTPVAKGCKEVPSTFEVKDTAQSNLAGAWARVACSSQPVGAKGVLQMSKANAGTAVVEQCPGLGENFPVD